MIAVAVVLIAGATWLLVPDPPEPRLQRLLPPDRPQRRPVDRRESLTILAGLVAAVGVWLMVGAVWGVVPAVATATLVPRLVRRLESRGARERRQALERQAPLIADLLAATLSSGAPMRPALAAVGEALGPTTAATLRPVLMALDLGAEPADAWALVASVECLRPVTDAVVRSTQSGAPLAGVLLRIAEDMRRDRQRAVEVAAQAAGVRAVAPLAACFLPAFLLLGVVPVVASLAGEVLGG